MGIDAERHALIQLSPPGAPGAVGLVLGLYPSRAAAVLARDIVVEQSLNYLVKFDYVVMKEIDDA